MDIDKLIELTLKNRGCSASFNTGIFDPKVGFFASYKDNVMKVSLEDFTKAKAGYILLGFLNKNKKLIREHDNFIGTWINNSLVYIDVSKQFHTEADCIKFARENKQLFYYDAKKGIAIEP